MVYEWVCGTRHIVDAQIAGEVCEELASKGVLTAKNLVEVSRPEDAPLHREFEWDDQVAGEKWREHQARNVINAIRVVHVEEDKENPEEKDDISGVRAYFSLKTQEPEYESIRIILSDEEKYNALLKMALRELIAFEKKYATIKELGKVFEAIREVESTIA